MAHKIRQVITNKVLQWKLDIRHYNATIEHVQGTLNTPADAFSRLVEKAPNISIPWC